MTLDELIPTVRALSQSDKLLLIQWIAGDLASIATPTDQERPFPFEADEFEDRAEAQQRRAIHAVALRNAAGRLDEEP